MVKTLLVLAVFCTRRLRRFLGLPVLDLTGAASPLKVGVREMERPPQAEQPKE